MRSSGGLADKKGSEPVKISGSMLARNTFVNLIGQSVPLLVGIVTIPFILRGLGTERFGLLSLALVVLGYFTVFDLGLGRAATKYVAENLGRGEDVSNIIWTAVTFQAILGLVGGLVLYGFTDLLVESILNVPPQLQDEARSTFHLIALSIPIVTISSSYRGVIEAAQRFDLVNAVTIPSSILTFILPIVGLYLGFALPGIVAMIMLARVAALVAFIVMVHYIVPNLRSYSGSFAILTRLFSFGIWVTISSIVSPILVYLDRFLIGSLLTMAAVAYYTAPYEAVTRLLIITTSLTMTLFPAFSTLERARDRQRIGTFYARSIKYVTVASGPIVVLIIIYAEEILQIWLGIDFAIESTVAMQILSLGVLVNSFAYTPFALLQGIGRPDLPAKFHMIELPIYIVIAWFFIGKFGIAGAACAWTLRIVLDAFLLFLATFKVYRLSPSLLAENGVTPAVIGLAIFAFSSYVLKAAASSLPLIVQFFFSIGFLTLFACATWSYVLDDMDRGAALKAVKLKRRV
jgi:O-antigen/teichoic acid export membrane protein